MAITRAQKKDIKKDIEEINQAIQSKENGKTVYNYLVSKYCTFDPDFKNGLPYLPVEVIGYAPNYTDNLLAVRGKLESLLISNGDSRFYKKEGFWPGFLLGILSSLVASGIWALIDYLIKQW